MLRLDCLLVNTEVANTVKQIIGYLGHKGIAEGKDVSFRKMYKELRKNGVEVDLETAAHIYANELPLNDARFTSENDLKYDTGQWFDDIVRNITLQKPKTGEQEIGDLSPSQAVVKGLADAFSNNVKDDQTTKSILKTLEDTYRSAAKKMLGELPNETKKEDLRTTPEIVQDVLNKENLGYRNLQDGSINGLAKMHEEVREQIAALTKHMVDLGDHDKAAQWENYAKSLEDANYSLMFSTNEGKKVLQNSLMEGGFVKDNKNGKKVLDWEKLSGNINSYEHLRDNVVESMKQNGFDDVTSVRVADSLSKEFKDIRGKIIEHAESRQQRLVDSWSDTETKVKQTLPEIVNKRVGDWDNLTKMEGNENEPLKFGKIEAQKIIGDALKNSESYGMDFGIDQKAIDWKKMAQDPPSEQELTKLVWNRLEEQGISGNKADAACGSLIRDYHQILTDKIAENAKRLLDTKEAAIDIESPARTSDLARLGQLHDLGIFNGEHDRLLAHVLGIDPEDIEGVRGIKEFAEKLSKLRQILGGNDFIAPSVVHTLNRDIHSILAPLISNKTKAMKRISILNKIYQIENSMLIATHGNILENHLSGAMELLTINLSQRLRFGKLGGSKGQDRKVMADYYGHVAAGGAENGLAPWQVGGTKERLSDEYTIHKMKGADWSKPGTWAKGMATAVLTIPRTFLSGADAAVKIGLMNAHMKSGVIDALMSTHIMTKDDAIKFYNDAIYGDGQLEKATKRAQEVYKAIGLKYVSKKELNITANELLRENLIGNRGIMPEVLEETMKNAYHQAGLGMGHESNNWISRRQQAFKQQLNREENQAITDHDWDKASSLRMKNTILNDVVLRFAASRFNWAWIRAEQAGLGILTGLAHYSSTNKKYKSIDVLDSEKMNEAAKEYQTARQKLFRGMVGLGLSAGGYAATRAIAQAMNPEKEDPMQTMFDEMKNNYTAKALYLKLSPIWMLQSYEYNEIKNGDVASKSLGALGKDFINLTNIGDSHDPSVQLAEAIKDISSAKSQKQSQKGYAGLGSMINNFIPHVPLVRQGKNVMQLTNWIEGKPASPMPPYPHSFLQGLLGGGVIQDVLGNVSDNELPKSLKGWGEKEKASQYSGAGSSNVW